MYQLSLKKLWASVSALLGDLRAVISISATKVDYGSFIEQSVSHRPRFVLTQAEGLPPDATYWLVCLHEVLPKENID